MTCRVIDSTKCKGLRLLNQIWFRLLGFSYCGLKISIFPSFLCSASVITHSSLIFPPESFCVFIKSIFQPKHRAKKKSKSAYRHAHISLPTSTSTIFQSVVHVNIIDKRSIICLYRFNATLKERKAKFEANICKGKPNLNSCT